MRSYLDFEKQIAELDEKIAELRGVSDQNASPAISGEVERLEAKADQATRDLYARLTPWQKTQVARHPARPHFKDYVAGLISEFTPMAGDRKFAEDEAVVGGLGRFRGKPVMVIGHEKGSDTESRIRHNFGMARPEGYRKAVRLMELADRFNVPVITLVDTAGEAVGQVNGLSVLSLAGFSFGRPSRITARVRLGAGKVVDIEREVDLGGPIHSKGVLILSGYLAANYAPDTPMSLSASLVFEQSYGGVDGDSASAAELFALLSALAEVPLRQDLAITGSINQMGQIQAIGGVNEKIEGFFDLCAERGLTASQGVIIPAANVQHLMLREDVVEACAAGKFSVYAIETAEQGIELLTGKTAGRRGPDGAYEAGSVNSKVEERLVGFAMARKRFGAGKDGGTAQ